MPTQLATHDTADMTPTERSELYAGAFTQILIWEDNAGALFLWDSRRRQHCQLPPDTDARADLMAAYDLEYDDWTVEWFEGDPSDANFDSQGYEKAEPVYELVAELYAGAWHDKPARVEVHANRMGAAARYAFGIVPEEDPYHWDGQIVGRDGQVVRPARN